jgi:hypothetical protein
MTISASLPLGAPDLQQSGEFSSATNATNPGGDFSALLFLIVAKPQPPNLSAPGEPQLDARGNDPVAFDAQAVSVQRQEPLALHSVFADMEETPRETLAPTNQVQFLIAGGEELPSEIAPRVPAQFGEKVAAVESDAAAPMEGNRLSPSVSSKAGQHWTDGTQPGNSPVREGQQESNPSSRQNLTINGDPDTSVAPELKIISGSPGAQDQKTANVLIDSSSDTPTLAAPAKDFAIGQTPPAAAPATRPNADSFLSPWAHSPLKDIASDTRPDGSITNPGSNKINGNLESAVSVPKVLGGSDQNPGSEFDDHGGKIFSDASASHDHSDPHSDSTVIFPSIGTANAENPRATDAKAPLSRPPVIDQLAGGIAANVRQSKHEAVIALDPPELGSVKINLTLDGGKVQIHIIAEAHESRNLIENHLPELKQALQIHRLDLVDARVDGGNWHATTGDLMHGFQHEPEGRQQWGWNSGNTSQSPSERAEIQRPDTAPLSSGRVSMWA